MDQEETIKRELNRMYKWAKEGYYDHPSISGVEGDTFRSHGCSDLDFWKETVSNDNFPKGVHV